MGAGLPDFSDPPVVEVALGVQFEPLELRSAHIGLWWQKIRDRFPRIEEQAPLDPAIERFGVPRARVAKLRFEMTTKPPVPRSWFLNEEGTELIQLQPDRFVHNWRKDGKDTPYPRYERVRDTFEKELREFEAFLGAEGLGRVVANQCEVTYVNHVMAGRGWDHLGQLDMLLRLFARPEPSAFLPAPEEARVSAHYVIPGAHGPIGRLHIAAEPAYRTEDDQPMYVLKLIARGEPEGEGIDGVLAFLDVGREWVVRGFADVTTAQMHNLWGRHDDH